MKEDFLQYIWENTLFDSSGLITSEGEKIIIHKVESNPNTIVPLFYQYGKVHTYFSNFSVELLESLKSEKTPSGFLVFLFHNSDKFGF